jgi:hypothetical protein
MFQCVYSVVSWLYSKAPSFKSAQVQAIQTSFFGIPQSLKANAGYYIKLDHDQFRFLQQQVSRQPSGI